MRQVIRPLAALALVAALFVLSGQEQPHVRVQPPAVAMPQLNHKQIKDLEELARKDKRIEAVARAICKLRGIDPDFRGFPYSEGPVWEYFIPQASLFLAQADAAASVRRDEKEEK